MLKRMSRIVVLMLTLALIVACSSDKKTISVKEKIERVQNSELKDYQGETYSFIDSNKGDEWIIATVGKNPKGHHIGIGLVSLTHGGVRLAIWQPYAVIPSVGMRVRVSRIGYANLPAADGPRYESIFLAEPATGK